MSKFDTYLKYINIVLLVLVILLVYNLIQLYKQQNEIERTIKKVEYKKEIVVDSIVNTKKEIKNLKDELEETTDSISLPDDIYIIKDILTNPDKYAE